MSYIAKNGRLYTSGASEALTLLDDKFSVNKSYSKGDSCIYNDYLWKFTSDKSAGEWDSSVVEQCRIMDFVDDVNGLLTQTNNKIEEIQSQLGSVNVTHVGQIILSTTLNTADKVKNFYGGNWQAFGAGRVLIGAGSNGGRNFTAGNTGGEYVHTLTVNEMPSHMHSSRTHNTDGAGINYLNVQKTDPGMGLTVGNEGTSAAGGGGAHNNMQPYVVVYMWRRVS